MLVTKNDYLLFDGTDLDIELPDDDNAKDKVARFINEVEEFVFMYLRKHKFTRNDVNDNNIQDFLKDRVGKLDFKYVKEKM